jgi:hypothetical protein
MGRMVLFDQQKSIWAHACPPALNSVAKGFDYLLRLLTRFGIALRSDDDFLERKLRSALTCCTFGNRPDASLLRQMKVPRDVRPGASE